MHVNDIPEAFQNKLRLAILTALIAGEQDFVQLKNSTGATDGNLSVQLSRLESAGYVECQKTFIGRKPHSSYRLSAKGMEDFSSYVQLLSSVLQQAPH